MQAIISMLVFIVAAYLNGVTMLAEFIEGLTDDTTASTVATEPSQITESLNNTEYTTQTPDPETIIPKILLENAEYQRAAIVESIPASQATSTAYQALVNVYCEHKAGNQIKVTTGTGFFVDTAGVILTNAHVAHFLLMDEIDGDTTCTIRTGNPAVARYEAELLYISPLWVRNNASEFTSLNPSGTGERDYALLYVTGSVDNRPLPRSFPALPFETELLRRSVVGQEVYAAGYPADAVFASQGRVPLIPKLATTSITELMTFGSNYADLFSILGSAVGERGASGGPVLTKNGDVIGMISTKGDATAFGEGALRAITISYIDRTITEETGFNLEQNVSGNLPYRARIFADTMVPFLRLVLTQEQGE